MTDLDQYIAVVTGMKIYFRGIIWRATTDEELTETGTHLGFIMWNETKIKNFLLNREVERCGHLVWSNKSGNLGYSVKDQLFYSIPVEYRVVAVRTPDGWAEVDIDARTALAMGLYELRDLPG